MARESIRMSAIRFETDLHKLHTLRKVRRGAGSTVPRAPTRSFARRSDLNERLLRASSQRFANGRQLGSGQRGGPRLHSKSARSVPARASQVPRERRAVAGLRHVLFLARQRPAPLGGDVAGPAAQRRRAPGCGASPPTGSTSTRATSPRRGACYCAGCGTARRARCCGRYTSASSSRWPRTCAPRNEALGLPRRRGRATRAPWRRPFEGPRRRAHPRDRVFHTQFVTIAAQHDWACELKRDMTLALTREFRESGADADAAAHENLLSALGPGAAAVSCGALACGAAEDAIARGAAFRAVRGRAENLLAFDARGVRPGRGGPAKAGKGKGTIGGSAGAALRAAGALRARLGADGVPLGARFRRRSRGGGGDGVFGGKKGRGERGARARSATYSPAMETSEASRWTSWCAETRRRLSKRRLSKRPPRWKTPCSSWSPRRDVVECGRVFIKMFTTRSPRHPRGFAFAQAPRNSFFRLTISPYSFSRYSWISQGARYHRVAT